MKTVFTLLSVLSVINFSKSQDLTTDLLLHYSFDGNFNDESGNAFNGVGNATLANDRFGNPNSACYFNGINQYIDLPLSPVLRPELPITYSCWVNFDVIDASKTVMMTNDFDMDNHAGAWINTSSTGNFAANYGNNTGNTSSPNRRTKVGETSLNAGQWYHLVAVIRGPQDMDLYVDCRNDMGSYSGSGSMMSYSGLHGSIGRKDATVGMPEHYFQGFIDDFRYWNRALTQEEVDVLCQFYLSVEESSDLENFIFSIFPNPTSGTITLKVSDESSVNSIEIISTTGAIVRKMNYTEQISMEGLEKGMYFVNLISNDNDLLGVRKVLVN